MSSLESDKGGARAEAAKQARYVFPPSFLLPIHPHHPIHPPTYLFLHNREWAAVKVSPEDVKFIVSELEVSTDVAELTLKQQGGNVVEALRKLLH